MLKVVVVEEREDVELELMLEDVTTSALVMTAVGMPDMELEVAAGIMLLDVVAAPCGIQDLVELELAIELDCD